MEPISVIFIILVILMSIVIHEVSHGYAAYLQGDMTAEYEGRLTLNPIKHLDPMGSILVPIVMFLTSGPIFGWAKPVPFNPYNLRNQRWGEAIVAIAGPASNILIAVVFSLIVRLMGANVSSEFLFLALFIVWINVGLALFNMIPIPPLDGSKVLFSFLPYRWSQIRWQLERYAIFLIFIIILIPQFSRLLVMAILYVVMFMTGLSSQELIGTIF